MIDISSYKEDPRNNFNSLKLSSLQSFNRAPALIMYVSVTLQISSLRKFQVFLLSRIIIKRFFLFCRLSSGSGLDTILYTQKCIIAWAWAEATKKQKSWCDNSALFWIWPSSFMITYLKSFLSFFSSMLQFLRSWYHPFDCLIFIQNSI